MTTLFKLCLTLLLSVVLGESTQGDCGRFRELETQLAEQNIKIESLQRDISKQETAINQLMIKVAMQEAHITQQLGVSQRREHQTQFYQNMQQMQNLSNSLNKNLNDMDDKIQSAVVTAMQNVSGRYCIQTDQLTDEIDDRIKSVIVSAMQNTTGRDCEQTDKSAGPSQNLTENQGLWLNWGDWSGCPISSCSGKGYRTRERVCFDSTTRREVNNCPGTAQENKTCTEGCKDCKALYDNGIRRNGVYTILLSPGDSFDVYCDMDDGGWTVIQNRFDGKVDFTREWSDYVNGFGALDGEFWLGLDKIYKLTHPTRRIIKLDMKTDDNRKFNAMYRYFSVGDADSSYSLRVSSFINGSISSNSFSYNNLARFSTIDNNGGNSCPGKRQGGWWYKNCVYMHLNGLYGIKDQEKGMVEHYGGYKNLVASRMKLQ